MDYFNWRLQFVVAATLFWIGYVLYRRKKDPEILSYWGFRTDNFKQVVSMILPFGIFSIIAFICIGIYQHTLNISWHIIPILLLYPVWGIIQQFLLIALVVGNLQNYEPAFLSRVFIITIASVLFSLVHYPVGWLMVGTFVLAIFYGLIYMKKQNIYALGIFHGWLGGIFYYTVVDSDPFLNVFGRFLIEGK